MRSGLTIAVLDFTATAQDHDVSTMLRDVLPDANILVVDPLDVDKASWWQLEQRAVAVSGKVSLTGIREVKLVSYCTGAILAEPVAGTLTKRGIRVSGIAIMDPLAITDEVVLAALHEVATSLGQEVATEQADALIGHNWRSQDLVENFIAEWICKYAKKTFPENPSAAELLTELAERYVNWLAFLCSARSFTGAVSAPVTVFASAERFSDLPATFPWKAAETNVFQTGGLPCLENKECADTFIHWVES